MSWGSPRREGPRIRRVFCYPAVALAPGRFHLHHGIVAASLFSVKAALAQGGAPAEGATVPTGGAVPAETSAGLAEAPPGVEQQRGPSREQLPSGRVRSTLREESVNPLRQSIFLFDQSMTTQTAGLGPAPQSYVPLYEIWLSFRPRYYFGEHLSVRGRFDYTKELTNNQTTTYYREDVFGDIWTDLVYQANLDRWPETKASVGVRALWPTSKISQANGTYATLGVIGGAQHKVQIRGGDAPAFNDFHVAVSFSYLHPFTPFTSGTQYDNFGYTRQDVDGRSFISHQLTGQTLVEHTLWWIVDAGLQITPRLSLTADFVVINQWHYAPTGNVHAPIAGGSATVASPTNDNQFVQNTWLTLDVDYALLDELDIGVGYYNLANYLAPDGQGRSLFGPNNIWWSPDARIFFDLTANLDVLWDDARGRHTFSTKQAQAVRGERITGHLR
jgi:hypothetical protein